MGEEGGGPQNKANPRVSSLGTVALAAVKASKSVAKASKTVAKASANSVVKVSEKAVQGTANVAKKSGKVVQGTAKNLHPKKLFHEL